MNGTDAGLMLAMALVALLCLRRNRTGDEAKRGGAEGAEEDAEHARALDEAFQQFNNFNEVP